jgi:hypothetical protein
MFCGHRAKLAIILAKIAKSLWLENLELATY